MNTNTARITGLFTFCFGVALIGFAFHATHSPFEQISSTLAGRYSGETIWFFAAGVIATMGGALLATFAHED